MASFRGGMEFFGGRPVKLVELRERLTAPAVWVRCVDRPVVTRGQRVEAGQVLTEPADPSLPCRIAPITGTVAGIQVIDDGADGGFRIHLEPVEAIASASVALAAPRRDRFIDWYEALRRTGPWSLDGLEIDLVAQFERVKAAPPAELLCIGADRFPPFADRSSLMIGFADDAVLGLKTLGGVVGAKRTTMLVGRTARVEKRLRASCRNFGVRLETLENVYPNADPTLATWLYSHGRQRLPHGADPLDHGVMLLTPWLAIRVARWLTRGALDLVQPLMVGRLGGAAEPTMQWVFPGQRLEIGQDAGSALLMGDPMTGRLMTGEHGAVVEAGDQLVTVLTRESARVVPLLADAETGVQDCIGCGWCVEVCPTRLQPIHLMKMAESGVDDETLALWLPWCIECGLCTHVCPSGIPLAQRLREAKGRDAEGARGAVS